MPVYVLPARDVLGDCGYLWESQLFKLGWNGLPKDKKAGRVGQVYNDGAFDVHFEALGYTVQVYPGEVRLKEITGYPDLEIEEYLAQLLALEDVYE